MDEKQILNNYIKRLNGKGIKVKETKNLIYLTYMGKTEKLNKQDVIDFEREQLKGETK